MAKKGSYDASHIVEMSELDHIRSNQAMYIGSTENINPLIFELFDNAVDEALAGFADIIGVFIDTKTGIVKVLDSGRGYPFDQKLPLEKDPPVLANTKLFTSGKFKKSSDESAYKISSGLHGVGGVCVYALSEWMSMEIYRDGLHATYKFNPDGTIERSQEKFKGETPFSTKVEFKANKEYFSSTDVDIKSIEERIRIVVANYPNLKMVFRVNGKDKIIKGSENDLIEKMLSKNVKEWHTFDTKNKDQELCHIKLGWEPGSFGPAKVLSAVNLVRVHQGVHINKLNGILRDVFQNFAKKHKFNFQKDDPLQGLKIYLNLHIIKTAFAAQVKTKLETAADINIMNGIETQVKSYFIQNEPLLLELLERFQRYRSALQSKSMIKFRAGNKSRFSTKFTKLRDCSKPMGELIIGEGDSAVGGLVQFRDPKKHAILPLRGVIPNSLTMVRKKLLDNAEVKDIVQALGTGIDEECDMSKLRYSKIIIATDADPAGHWIASLLIILFATLTPDLIKNGHLFVCRTPLFGTIRKKQFVPLWTKEEVDEARTNNEKVNRYKGLGEFKPKDLTVFTLEDSTRILIPIQWSVRYNQIFDLFISSAQKRKLIAGEWELKDE